LPGRAAEDANFASRFMGQFIGAGLAEELVKAIPILIGLGITLRAHGPMSPLMELIRVRGPLDGILFGVAAGAAFTFIETLFYVDRVGFLLLFPRVITFSGHMAYSGIFGYFIGLAAIRPAKWWQLILVGWCVAAVLHGLWNASSAMGMLALSAGVAFICFVACILKARQLEGQRSHNQVQPDDGSIVAGQSASAATSAGTSAGPVAAVRSSTFQLLIEGRIIPLQPGLRLDVGRLPGLGHANGVVFAVTTHPKDPTIMGLQNLGDKPWTAIHGGSPKQIDPQRNIRVSRGTLIAFGSVQGSIQEIGPTQ
jgi:hypothetical protein